MKADAWRMLRACVQAPEWMEPWLDRFYDRSDSDLVLSLRDRPQKAAEVRERQGCRQADLVRAWQRGVLAWGADDRLSPADFHVRFDNARGLGWEISREKAKDLIQEANRAGLMQSGELALDAEGRLAGAICNCCSDCCFPHLLAEAVQAEKLWPQTRYLARINHDLCSGCGRCARRCPFQALTLTKAAQDETREVVLSETICRGCGLCATGCPEQAITMHSLDVGPGWDMRELLG